MNVLQLIDSLDAGGAEQIAVHLANHFPEVGMRSFLCATRSEGILKEQLHEDIGYLYLKKKRTFDSSALWRLKRYIKTNKIEIVHAHTTSFFFATLLKLVCPKIILVWHTHLGARAEKRIASDKFIKICSRFFDGIITVNMDLKTWCLQHLSTKNIFYVPNGVLVNSNKVVRNKRAHIVYCVANLKEPKNHRMLIEAFAKVHKQFSNWTLHLIGKGFNDRYEKELRETIHSLELDAVVSVLGQQKDVPLLLQNGAIGVLSSDNEGLPMALLEYGAANLAVIVTDVGECAAVLGDAGIVVPSNNSTKFAEALRMYFNDPILLKNKADQFSKKVCSSYTITNMTHAIHTIYKNLRS